MHTYTDVKADYILCKFQSLLPHERDLNNARRRLREKGKKIKKQNKIRLCAFGIVFVRNLRLDDEKYDNKLRMEKSDGGRRSHSSSTIAARK